MTCCVTWVANWLSAAQGYIKLTSAYSRLEKLWVRFDQTLFFLCIWILLFFASWGTVRIILGPRLYFPFSCLHFTPSVTLHTCQGRLFLGDWGTRSRALVSSWSQQYRQGGSYSQPGAPITRHIFAGTQGQPIHRIRIVAQINGPWPGTDRGNKHFFGYKNSFSLVLCLPTYAGRWFFEFPTLHK